MIMKLKCLASKCNYNNNLICENVYLYVNCFRLSEWESNNVITKYLNDFTDK